MERRNFEDSFKDAFDGAEMNPSDNVWSGIERELEKSEGSFQQAFYGAEINPSDNVWTGIELELEKAEGDKIRRRLRFYKLVAAASVAFAAMSLHVWCVVAPGFLQSVLQPGYSVALQMRMSFPPPSMMANLGLRDFTWFH